MMEQLAERRMLREEEAVADVEDDSEEEEDEEGDEEEDEDDEEDDEEDEEEEVRSLVIGHTTLFSFVVGYDRGAEDGRGEADVLHFRCPYVRAAGTSGLS